MAVLADIPVPYSILYQPAAVVEGDGRGWRATMAFRTAYADKMAFLVAVSGTIETFGAVQRVVPLRHPEHPGLLAQAFRAEGMGTPTQTPQGMVYSDARITVDFASVLFGVSDDQPFQSTRLRMGGTFITQPASAYRFNDNTPIKNDVGVFVPEIGYSITAYGCPGLDDDVIAGLVGKVNSSVFMGRPAGTMRFDGCDSEMSTSISMSRSYTKQFAFTFRPRPWNQIMRPDGAWEAATNRASGQPQYEAADFSPLLA